MKKIIAAIGGALAILASAPALDGREVFSMNEGWAFVPSRSVSGGRYGRSVESGETVNLPHTWNAADFMSDEGYRRGFGTYTKQVEIPDSYQGKRVFLKFEGAGSMATVLVNNSIVGEHKGPYNTFVFEITDKLKIGTSNTIVVLCDNGPQFDIAPQGGDFNVYGGLYRDAWMIVTEAQCISPLYFGSNGVLLHQSVVNEARVEVSAEVHVSSLSDYEGCEVYFAIQDAEGRTVAEKKATSVNNGIATCNAGFDNPHLWDGKSDPYLYKAVTVLKQDGIEIDRVEEMTGFRYFWVDPDKGFFLNGKHVKLQGVCRHQDWPEVASALSREHHLADYDLFDEIGANALRLAHYPQAKFMFQEADRRGYVVWEEIPFVGGYVDAESFDDNLKIQLQEMIAQNYNHPSICFWGLENEIHEPIDGIIGEMNDIAHRLDPGRLTVVATDVEASFTHITDATGWNKYFGWYYDTTADFGPFMDNMHSQYPQGKFSVSEYGAGASINQHLPDYRADDEVNVRAVSRTRNHPEEKQTYIHYNNWKTIAERDYIWGSFVWNMFDFASSLRREGDTNNQNDKGLVTHDRKTRKDAFYFYKANWNKSDKMVHLCSADYVERESELTDVVVFTTAPSVKLYINGKLVGTQKVDEYATSYWKDVKLSKGNNTVVVKTSHGEDSAVWTVK